MSIDNFTDEIFIQMGREAHESANLEYWTVLTFHVCKKLSELDCDINPTWNREDIFSNITVQQLEKLELELAIQRFKFLRPFLAHDDIVKDAKRFVLDGASRPFLKHILEVLVRYCPR